MTDQQTRTVIVVGGGAAGLIASKRAAERGAQVTLIEKNDRLGMKILISGGGKCNLTHAGSVDDIVSCFRANEGRFLKPSFYRYTNEDFLFILHQAGMHTYVRPDGRIFPVEPANAKDVVSVIEQAVRSSGVNVKSGVPVSGIVVENNHAVGVRTETKVLQADRVIIAVGGSSYPATGTTGDGWRWANDVGHSVMPLRPALAPLYLENPEPEWSGVALRDVTLRARLSLDGKAYARWRGDLLFTHKGVSGPCALGVSRNIGEQIAHGTINGGVLEVDLAPDMEYEKLQFKIKSDLKYNSRSTVGAIVNDFLPHRLVTKFMETANIDPQTRCTQFSSRTLNRLNNTLKSWPLGGVRSVPLERGEVVAGGVSLDEIDPKTMESRIVKGLYFCGEILDIAGPVGGYNLQAAWSTGYVAGDSAAV